MRAGLPPKQSSCALSPPSTFFAPAARGDLTVAPFFWMPAIGGFNEPVFA